VWGTDVEEVAERAVPFELALVCPDRLHERHRLGGEAGMAAQGAKRGRREALDQENADGPSGAEEGETVEVIEAPEALEERDKGRASSGRSFPDRFRGRAVEGLREVGREAAAGPRGVAAARIYHEEVEGQALDLGRDGLQDVGHQLTPAGAPDREELARHLQRLGRGLHRAYIPRPREMFLPPKNHSTWEVRDPAQFGTILLSRRRGRLRGHPRKFNLQRYVKGRDLTWQTKCRTMRRPV
jgi:hypothetical protein